MNFTRIEAELYRLVDRFNERQITARQSCNHFLNIFILLEMETVEHVRFYLKTKLKISTKFTCKNEVFSNNISFQTQLILIKIKMNDFSALNTRVSADKREQVLLILSHF